MPLAACARAQSLFRGDLLDTGDIAEVDMDADPDPAPPLPTAAAAAGKRPLYESDEEGARSTPTTQRCCRTGVEANGSRAVLRDRKVVSRKRRCLGWKSIGFGLGGRACKYSSAFSRRA